MAAHTDNDVTIAAPLELVWRIANDVENWPNLFVEEYAKAELLERHDDRLVFRLTTTPDEQGRSFSWVSERFLDHDTHTTTSRRLSTGPFVYMHIVQHFEPVDGGVRLRWVQDFEVRPGAPLSDAQFAERINGNSRIQLAEHKRFMEQTHHRGDGAVTTISTEGGLSTFVNVFTCEPADQEALVSTLLAETGAVVSTLPGFVSANIHRSVDGCRVINYAQWSDLSAFQEMMRGERGKEFIQKVHQYAKGVDVHLYEVSHVFTGAQVTA